MKKKQNYRFIFLTIVVLVSLIFYFSNPNYYKNETFSKAGNLISDRQNHNKNNDAEKNFSRKYFNINW